MVHDKYYEHQKNMISRNNKKFLIWSFSFAAIQIITISISVDTKLIAKPSFYISDITHIYPIYLLFWHSKYVKYLGVTYFLFFGSHFHSWTLFETWFVSLIIFPFLWLSTLYSCIYKRFLQVCTKKFNFNTNI